MKHVFKKNKRNTLIISGVVQAGSPADWILHLFKTQSCKMKTRFEKF